MKKRPEIVTRLTGARNTDMPTHSETKHLPYTAQQMYDLVADVASYPEFLPWTAAARVRSREDKGDHEVMLADLVISFKVFRERFGSRVTLYPQDHRIDTEYLDGPFRHMISNWRFEDVEDGAEADAVRQSRREQRLARAQARQEYVARPSPPVARVAFFM